MAVSSCEGSAEREGGQREGKGKIFEEEDYKTSSQLKQGLHITVVT